MRLTHMMLGRTDLSLCCCFLLTDKPLDLMQGKKESILKPFALATAKPRQERRQETTTYPPLITSTTHHCIYLKRKVTLFERFYHFMSKLGTLMKEEIKGFFLVFKAFWRHCKILPFVQLSKLRGSRKKQVFGTPVTDLGQSCKIGDRNCCQALLAHQTNPHSSLLSFTGTRFDLNENSSIFRPLPTSDVDIMGKKRFVGKEPQTHIVMPGHA